MEGRETALDRVVSMVEGGVPFDEIEDWIDRAEGLTAEQRSALWLVALVEARPEAARELARRAFFGEVDP